MSTNSTVRPPFDPELEAALELVAQMLPPTITPELIPMLRANPANPITSEMLEDAGIRARDVTIPGYRGDPIEVTVLEAEDRVGTGPGIVHTHGGGMIFGDRWTGLGAFFDAITRHNAVVVTVEYRLAPAGGSAGGGLAAGMALMARDRGGPVLRGQMLFYPMLDDRDESISTFQIQGVGVWDRGSNITGWSALLGERRGGADVSVYAAPSRATDLSGLPPAFIDCGSAEVFRDEDIAYASAIWACGGQAELHVWPGGFHAFEGLAPEARLSKEMVAVRANWLDRILA